MTARDVSHRRRVVVSLLRRRARAAQSRRVLLLHVFNLLLTALILDHSSAAFGVVLQLYKAFFGNSQHLGHLLTLARTALPHAQRCAHKVDRLFASYQFFDYCQEMQYYNFARRWFKARVRMLPATFELLCGEVELAQHPLLTRRGRGEGGVRNDTLECAPIK